MILPVLTAETGRRNSPKDGLMTIQLNKFHLGAAMVHRTFERTQIALQFSKIVTIHNS